MIAPAKPEGLLHFSTCRDCQGLLRVTEHGQTVHPLCDDRPLKVEGLAHDWLDAVVAGNDEVALRLQAEIDRLDRRRPKLLEAALRYAAWGWPVFPLRPKDKRPATSNGFKSATTDLERIRKWWDLHPHSNIGLATGHVFDIVDVDTPISIDGWDELHRKRFDVHGWVTTASGGAHFYVTPRAGAGNKAGWLDGVDYRGMGGYVVAPPSTLGTVGRSWFWTQHPSPVLTGVGDTYGHDESYKSCGCIKCAKRRANA